MISGNNNGRGVFTDPILDLTEKIVGETKSSFSDLNLYHEEDNKIERVIRIKHFKLPNKGEKWKILENDKIIFVLEGAKLSKKHKNFLHSIEGMSFLIALGKSKEGIKNVAFVKKCIDQKLTSKS